MAIAGMAVPGSENLTSEQLGDCEADMARELTDFPDLRIFRDPRDYQPGSPIREKVETALAMTSQEAYGLTPEEQEVVHDHQDILLDVQTADERETVANWLRTENSLLGDQTPLALIAQGQADRVREVVKLELTKRTEELAKRPIKD